MIVRGTFFAAALLTITIVVGLSSATGELSRHLLPMLPYVIVHVAALRYPAAMPSWLVFASGFSMDLATHGPTGYCASVYLLGLLCLHMAPDEMLSNTVGRSILTLGTVLALALLQFLILSLYLLQTAPVMPVVLTAAILAGVLVLAEWILPYPPERGRGYGADAAVLRRGE